MGRITRDPEVRYCNGENGQMAIANFSLAVDSGFGKNKKANFFNMVAFGKVAETVEKYLRKGTKILAECEASQNQYTKQDGTKVKSSKLLPSAFFTINKSGDTFVIKGGGFGHGIGMSQTGANEMAKCGKNYQEILTFFYQGVTIG